LAKSWEVKFPSGMPPRPILPLLQKVKAVYLLWFSITQHLPASQRHTLGRRIDDLFVETIEMLVTASFLPREEKIPFVRTAIRKLDTLKIFLSILWETKSLDNKKFIALSVPLEEIGRMTGGWYGQLVKPVSSRVEKQNSSSQRPEEK
jgi:hypothetical protein